MATKFQAAVQTFLFSKNKLSKWELAFDKQEINYLDTLEYIRQPALHRAGDLMHLNRWPQLCWTISEGFLTPEEALPTETGQCAQLKIEQADYIFGGQVTLPRLWRSTLSAKL